MQPPQLYTSKEIAQFLAVSEPALAKWRERGTGPRAIRVKGSIRYRAVDIVDWLREQNPGIEFTVFAQPGEVHGKSELARE
ncbi:helix-turn-helix domain-containing protein [Microbacterium foliorum]|uniref:helix-turn-helix transcriptional regulator n=1 Tax=Rothia terrae TaxID=396015 RepID=UPI003441DDA8